MIKTTVVGQGESDRARATEAVAGCPDFPGRAGGFVPASDLIAIGY